MTHTPPSGTRLLLLGAAAIAAGLLVRTYVTSPMQERTDLDADRLERLRTGSASSGLGEERPPADADSLHGIRLRALQLERGVAAAVQPAVRASALAELAGSAGLIDVAVAPAPPAAGELYARHPFSIEAEGGFPEVAGFLAEVAALGGAFVPRVERIAVADPEAGGASGAGGLEVELAVDLWAFADGISPLASASPAAPRPVAGELADAARTHGSAAGSLVSTDAASHLPPADEQADAARADRSAAAPPFGSDRNRWADHSADAARPERTAGARSASAAQQGAAAPSTDPGRGPSAAVRLASAVQLGTPAPSITRARPFLPALATGASAPPELRLSGVIASAEGSLAVLWLEGEREGEEGRTPLRLRPGESSGGVLLIAAAGDSALIEVDGLGPASRRTLFVRAGRPRLSEAGSGRGG